MPALSRERIQAILLGRASRWEKRFDTTIVVDAVAETERLHHRFAPNIYLHLHNEADAADRTLTPEERLDAVGECVRHYLALRNEPEQRFCRVYRVLDQKAG